MSVPPPNVAHMRSLLPVLFLSGAGLPAWIWDEVRGKLPTDSRVADRPAGADASLAAYADAALATADGWDRFVVVSHSVGGVVASELVARAPERVAGVMAVAASVPHEGRSFLDALPFPQRHLVGLVMRVAGTRPPAKQIRDGLAQGVAAEVADRIVADFRPESQRLYRDPVSPRTFPEARIFVLTQQDREFSEALQRRYAATLGGTVTELRTGHLPMLEQPAQLADLVADLLG